MGGLKCREPGSVTAMLDGTGAEASRPDGLSKEFGMVEGGYRLTETQAQAILDLRLHRLTGLEQDKIVSEFKELLEKIAALMLILTDPDRLKEVIREELNAIVEQYGDGRRTEIMEKHLALTLEDLISEEEMVVTLSHAGYAKSQPLSDYRAQRRGGRGKSATAVKEEDFVDKLFIANSHDTMLCFSSAGKVYWKKVYELPQAGRASRGKPIVNLLPLEEGERINAVMPVREFTDDHFLLFATSSGTVKKTPLSAYSRPRANGIIAVDLRGDDTLVDVAITDGSRHIMLFTNGGKVIRFSETDVRSVGRDSVGVRGMRLGKDQKVIALIVVQEGEVLTVTENGYGKRTSIEDYPLRGRGGQGVISIQTSERNGEVVGAVQSDEQDDIMLITNAGTLVRTRVAEISVLGRNTQGVRLIRLQKDELVIGMEKIVRMEGDEDEENDFDADDQDKSLSDNNAPINGAPTDDES